MWFSWAHGTPVARKTVCLKGIVVSWIDIANIFGWVEVYPAPALMDIHISENLAQIQNTQHESSYQRTARCWTCSRCSIHFSNEGPRFLSSPWGLNDAALNLAAAKEGGPTLCCPRGWPCDRSNQWGTRRVPVLQLKRRTKVMMINAHDLSPSLIILALLKQGWEVIWLQRGGLAWCSLSAPGHSFGFVVGSPRIELIPALGCVAAWELWKPQGWLVDCEDASIL